MKQNLSVEALAKKAESLGAGEILLTVTNLEGTWLGYDLQLIKKISSEVSIPVIAHGGAGCIKDLLEAINIGGASAVAVGSMVTFQKKGFGVLINYPEPEELEINFYSKIRKSN